MNNPMKTREKVVGAKGFEPSTSWSRNRVAKILKALSGVAYVNDKASFSSQLYPSCTQALPPDKACCS